MVHLTTKKKHLIRGHYRRWYATHKDEQVARVGKRNARVRAENARRIDLFLAAHPCIDCQEADPIVLEFDHVRGKKKHDVSSMAGRAMAWATIEEEIRKCDVRCANCHRRVTAKRRALLGV